MTEALNIETSCQAIVRCAVHSYFASLPMSKKEFIQSHSLLKMTDCFDYVVPTMPNQHGGINRSVGILPADVFSELHDVYLDASSGIVYTFFDDLSRSDQARVNKLLEAARDSMREARARESGLHLPPRSAKDVLKVVK